MTVVVPSPWNSLMVCPLVTRGPGGPHPQAYARWLLFANAGTLSRMNQRSYERNTDAAACDASIVDAGAVSRVLETLPPCRDRDRLAGVFAALADPTRVKILLALDAEPLCVCELTEIAGVTQSAVSHQLRLLRELDLVAWERDGKRAVYRLADDHVRVLLEIGLEHAREGDTR